MPSVSLKAHDDGERIQLDEPFDLPRNARLLVTVLPASNRDGDRVEWLAASKEALARALADNEPEYTPGRHLAMKEGEEGAMTETDRLKYLRIALLLVGVIFTVGIYPLTIIWPSGWSWHTGQSDYLQMILGIYATLGVFLIIASRDPLAHRSLIWFTVWSSVVHGGIMAAQSFAEPHQIGHLCGDVLALFVVAVALGVLMPRTSSPRAA